MEGGEADSGAPTDALPTRLETPRSSSGSPKLPEETLPTGTVLGRYVVLSQLGIGGMGVVYAAYDPELNRRVAVKIMLQRALSGTDAAGRMHREAQALARLSHPNVVAVHDVGSVGERMFLAMELVDGVTLSDWLKKKKRSWREILDAFIPAGRGLAAAHAAGVIHRDFKPSNVLVGKDGRVRVMDFGLARADDDHEELDPTTPITRDALSDELTVTGTLMGTPLYMAPEAHRGAVPSESSDQFSFCVALYDSLYGSAPFDAKLPATDDNRWAIRHPRGAVPGWIGDAVVRGLAREPKQRFPSMTALLDALERDPRRKRWLAATAGTVLAAGAAVWVAQGVRHQHAVRECEREGAAIDDNWNDARASAIGKAFDATGVSYAGETWTHARTRLADYAGAWHRVRADVCTREPPLARAARACLDEQRIELEALLGQLERPDPATVKRAATAAASLPNVTACTDEARLRHQPEPPGNAIMQARVTALRVQLADAAASGSLEHDQFALQQATSVLADAKQLGWAPLVIDAKLAVARAQKRVGAYKDARATLEDAFFDASAAGRDDAALSAATELAFVLASYLHDNDALLWGRLAQTLADRNGHTSDLAAAYLAETLGEVKVARGDDKDAQPLFEHAIALYEKLLGDSSPALAATLDSLSGTYMAKGDPAKAREVGERALAIRERVHGENHPDIAVSLGNLSNTYGALGDVDKAFETQKRALALREKLFGPDQPEVAMSLNNLANGYVAQGKFDQAIEYAARARAIYTAKRGPDDPEIGMSLRILCQAYSGLGQYQKAVDLGEQAMVLTERGLGPEHPKLAYLLNELALAYGELGQPQKGVDLAVRSREIYKKKNGLEDFTVAIPTTTLAILDNDLHRYQQALDEATAARAVLAKKFGPDHPVMTEVLGPLGDAQMGLGHYKEAIELYEQNVKLMPPFMASPSEQATARMRLARGLWDGGGDRKRAVTVATEAKDLYAGDGDAGKAGLKRAEDWLASHK